jgi:hypothetical protein
MRIPKHFPPKFQVNKVTVAVALNILTRNMQMKAADTCLMI